MTEKMKIIRDRNMTYMFTMKLSLLVEKLQNPNLKKVFCLQHQELVKLEKLKEGNMLQSFKFKMKNLQIQI